MSAAHKLITQHLSTLALAVRHKSAAGRGSSKKVELYGIKKVRELILELAVRGKLVPQDPNDEPASVLLEKIAAEKTRLIKENKIKKPKKLPPIKGELFDLPAGWTWSRLDDLCPMSLFDGDWIESKDQDPKGSIRLIQLSDVGVNTFQDASSKFINEETFFRLNCTEILAGDILIARLPNPIGRACIFPILNKKAITAVDVAILRPLDFINRQYVVHAINSVTFRNQVEAYGKGATRFRISTGNLKSILVPVPPKEESKRIVAKVDELMGLCDQIEEQTHERLSAQSTLVKELLSTLTRSADAAELEHNWNRISQHFTALFTTEESIDELKKTILQLAVMGKLVPQDPNDEPASVLLEKIAAEKKALIAEGKIKKQKPLPPIGEDEKPFALPEGWEWVRIGSFSEVKGGKRIPKGSKLVSEKTDHAYIRVVDMKDGSVNTENLQYLTKETQQLISQYTISSRDLYITIAGTIGNVGVVPKELDGMNLTENAAKIMPNGVNRLWLQKSLSSRFLQAQFKEQTNQLAQPKLALHRISSAVVPLPPEQEAPHIVAKVDELMALCDKIKTHLRNQQQTRLHLVDAMAEKALT